LLAGDGEIIAGHDCVRSTRLQRRGTMKQVLFVQGAGKDVHEQWDSKLVESLRRELGPGYEVRYPLMPNEADPQVAVWKVALQREIAALQRGAIVVGHSLGGTILIDVLAERALAVGLGAIVLIAAPFVGHGGWTSDEIALRPDLAAHLPPDVPVFLYHGDKDTIAPIAHVALYAAAIPHARVHRLANRDHQLDNDLSEVASDIRVLEADSSDVRRLRASSHRRDV
jgi:predicted alpha/beta hydrolase family esterase